LLLIASFAALLPALALAHSAMDRFWGEVPVDMQISGDVLVTKELVVPPDVTLTVEAGTIVRFERSKGAVNRILVRGGLIAAGTADKPIKFMPKDGSSGKWQGVIFEKGATGRMEHCIVEGATSGVVSSGNEVNMSEVEVRK